MRVFLTVPPALKSHMQIPDLGLAYLATALRKQNHSVTILQAEKHSNHDDFSRALQEFRPDVLGIKTFSLEIASIRTCTEIARKLFPDLVIVLGGPHMSVIPSEESMAFFKEADFGVRGEGEIAFPKLLEVLESGSGQFEGIPGLIRRTENGIETHPSYFHRQLDDFDFPAWDLIDPRNYKDRWYFWSPEYPGAPILTSRGCPYRCTFCAQNVVNGKIIRRRSLERVLEEMELLMTRYGVVHFDFIDDNFLMDPKYVQRLCEAILARGWKVRWNCCGARLDYLDKELVKLMDKAGCNVISVGFESGSQRVLDYMRKGIDKEVIRQKARLITSNTSIRIMGLFILGFPTETESETRQTIRFILDLPLFLVSINTYIVMPGCEEYDRLIASGEIKPMDGSNIGLDEHVYAPRGMSLRRLGYLYNLAFFRFFLRPLTLYRILRYSWRRIPHFVDKALRKLIWKSAY